MSNKRVVYTAIFGGKDVLREPKEVSKGVDYICFTDTPFSSKNWSVRKVKGIPGDVTRSARRYKTQPHIYLKEYEQSVWIDGNIVVRKDVNHAFDKYLADTALAVYDHCYTKGDDRGTVKEELEALTKLSGTSKHKDDAQVMEEQFNRYKEEGFPDNNGLISSMIIFRRHNDEKLISAMDLWWDQIKKYSKRDQLSFNYVMWKSGIDFSYIKEDSRDNVFFKHVPHGKKKSILEKVWKNLR